VRRAYDLAHAALGMADPVITTAECLYITAAALAAKETAIHGGQHRRPME